MVAYLKFSVGSKSYSFPDSSRAHIVMAAGSVMKEPSIGPMVRIVNHQAVKLSPIIPAIRCMMDSTSFNIGLLAARIITVTTNRASVKLTSWLM